MLNLPFKQVDVFTEEPFMGNPVAVVNLMEIDEGQVKTEQMQSIANWTNLSETTFLLKPTKEGCDYKLRIFTPNSELPFAGHPSIGSCKAYLEYTSTSLKDTKTIYQECGVGVVELTAHPNGEIFFKAAHAEARNTSAALIEGIGKALALKLGPENPITIDAGPHWFTGLTKDAQQCLNLNPNFADLRAISLNSGVTGVIVAGLRKHCGQHEYEYEMRAFAPAVGVDEDPVCGSGSLALIKYLQITNQFTETTKINITQGSRVGRNGKVTATIKIDPVTKSASYYVGGKSLVLIDGNITL